MTEFESAPAQEFDPNAEHLFAEPPKWPKVVGTLSIVFGSIAVFCGAFGFVGPMMNTPSESDLGGAPLPPVAMLTALQIGSMIFGILVNLLLIAAGALCVGYKPKTRSLHLVYAVLTLVSLGLAAWATFDQQAAMQQWLADYPSNTYAEQYQQGMQIMGPFLIGLGIVMTIVTLSWPTFCLIWFGISKTKPSDITGAAEPAEHDDRNA